MHRLVLYSTPVVIDGRLLYGKLVEGEGEGEILANAIKECTEIISLSAWKSGAGCKFREEEGWEEIIEDGSDEINYLIPDKVYTWIEVLGVDIPVQFVNGMKYGVQVALVSNWVAIRFSDFDNYDFIINPTLHRKIQEDAVLDWIPIGPEDDDGLPF